MHVCPECGASLEQAGYCPEDGNELRPRGDDVLLGIPVGQYRIARLLGVGGMGRVYKAVHPQIGSRVAVKVLSRDCADNRELVDRFFAEARAVNLIRHENIINVLDLATLPDGRPYITMEYLDGQPLAEVMEQGGQLPLGSLARLVGEVLGALSAAHATGIVHRDLKPDNIFVSPQGRAKVLDFGIAKLMPELAGGHGPTRTGSLLGTPHYMSPEQANAQPVDARTDIYAMGVILYEGATGNRPFGGSSLFELLRQVLEQPPPPLRPIRPDMPPAYEAVVLRAMAKDPNQRFQSANELADALAAAVQGLPDQAWAPLVGAAGQSSARIGPPSVRTPSSTTPQPGPGPTPAPGGPALGHAATVGATYTPAPGPAPRAGGGGGKSKAPLIAVGALVAVGIAVAAVFALSGGDDSKDDTATAANNSDTTGGNAEAPATPAAKTKAGNAATGANPINTGLGAGGVDQAALMKQAEKLKAQADKWRKQMAEAQKRAAAVAKNYTIPGYYKPAGWNPAKFDVSGFIGEATAKAKEIYSDAVLVRIDAQGVRPDGHSNITLDTSFNILYRFASPSRAKRPANLPRGVEHKPNCLVYVMVDQNGVRPWALKGWKCDMPRLGPPRCTAEQLWRKAAKKGAPTSNAVAQLGYWAAPRKKIGRWWFKIDDKNRYFLPDDC
jgi:serine/threonine-protein kinase